jgi:metal-dependent amidase/aminoacylase/carboxypeptidase family protein
VGFGMLDLIKIRRDLHQIPETDWKEFKTSDYVYGVITELVKDRKDIEITRHKTALSFTYRALSGKRRRVGVLTWMVSS